MLHTFDARLSRHYVASNEMDTYYLYVYEYVVCVVFEVRSLAQYK